jgi:DNA-binding transcriptional LysR family regulator
VNKFLAINIFVRVAGSGSFTQAARKLGISVSAATKAVARLEDDLGIQLLNRSTRRIGLTDAGQNYHDQCVRILADLEQAESAIQQGGRSARGRLRAVVPLSFGRVTLVPELPRFARAWPDILLDLAFSDSDRTIDLIAEGYDVAVRTGQIDDTRLVTRILTRSPQVTVASPDYLARHGTPLTPSDLLHHNCILANAAAAEWRYRVPGSADIAVRITGNAIIASGDARREAAVAGLGIVQGTGWLHRKDLEEGSVVEILRPFRTEGTPISVLYPANRHVPAKIRAFVDFLVSITKEQTALAAVVPERSRAAAHR